MGKSTLQTNVLGTLLKIKVLHDAIEEPFYLKWFHKEPLRLKNRSVSQKVVRNKVLLIIKR